MAERTTRRCLPRFCLEQKRETYASVSSLPDMVATALGRTIMAMNTVATKNSCMGGTLFCQEAHCPADNLNIGCCGGNSHCTKAFFANRRCE